MAKKNRTLTTVANVPEKADPIREQQGYRWKSVLVIGIIALLFGFAFAWANPKPEGHFDYQFRFANAVLSGRFYLDHTESWLSEMIPFEGRYYSAFPFGSVLCMVPAAMIQKMRGISEFPVREVLGVIAGLLAVFTTLLSGRYGDLPIRRGLLVTLTLCGTWLLSNMIFGNAWQLALAMAAVGEFAALYFLLRNRQPFWAGLSFAVAFGNRTEIILLTPLLLYLLMRTDPFRIGQPASKGDEDALKVQFDLRTHGRDLLLFLVCPFLLGCATLWYNYARFHSPLDFGYTHIPNMMQEIWYRHGLFSLHAVPMNIHAMFLLSSWEPLDKWPYLRPALFGGSIFTACPFLLLLLREGGRDRALRTVCWLAIAILSVALLTHGNAGGVQYSYRYAIVLLPWIFLLWLDQQGGKVKPLEWLLYTLSLLASGWSLYIFHWAKDHAHYWG